MNYTMIINHAHARTNPLLPRGTRIQKNRFCCTNFCKFRDQQTIVHITKADCYQFKRWTNAYAYFGGGWGHIKNAVYSLCMTGILCIFVHYLAFCFFFSQNSSFSFFFLVYFENSQRTTIQNQKKEIQFSCSLNSSFSFFCLYFSSKSSGSA